MATRSDGNHKHGCLIVKGGAIIAKGWNLYANDRHAEFNAINKPWHSELKGATIYVVRLRKEQAYGLSRPCPKCEALIRNAGIVKVVYSTNDPQNPLAIEKFN